MGLNYKLKWDVGKRSAGFWGFSKDVIVDRAQGRCLNNPLFCGFSAEIRADGNMGTETLPL